jgi:hypothetical protein
MLKNLIDGRFESSSSAEAKPSRLILGFEQVDLSQHYPHGDVVMPPPAFDSSIPASLPTALAHAHSGKGRASAADVSI